MAKKKSKKKKTSKKQVGAHVHAGAKRTNIPTAEFESILPDDAAQPIPVSLDRPGRDVAEAIRPEVDARDPGHDPQLVWRGKDTGPALTVPAPPLFIQEKVHPKVLIDDLRKQTEIAAIAKGLKEDGGSHHTQPDLFADFNGLPDDPQTRTEFYQHPMHWQNRFILGDSLAVMASLAEREGLRGQVQCIYLDPPYGIKFNSNFQWSTTSRDVKDGKADHITREPEQVKAFRDTWRDGIHSYLTYLRDRLTVARDLLHDTGSIFVQIGDENVHRVRAVLDEVFGAENCVGTITFQKTGSTDQALLPQTVDYLLFYAKNIDLVKYRQLFEERKAGSPSLDRYDQAIELDGTARRLTPEERTLVDLPDGAERGRLTSLMSSRPTGEGDLKSFDFQGQTFEARTGTFKSNREGLIRLGLAGRLQGPARTLNYFRRVNDFRVLPMADRWESVQLGTGLTYVVQTSNEVVARCILMATDPGDLVLDPTCGSGTTAFVAEQWGRRWITIDTSRVSLALARARIMGARYPYYLLADSPEGHEQEYVIESGQLGQRSPDLSGYTPPGPGATGGDLRQGFVYERVPHITLKSIANNARIDVIYEKFQQRLEPLREQLNDALGTSWEEWNIPRSLDDHQAADGIGGPALKKAADAHARWWEQRIERQKEIDAAIAAAADFEYLYDKPYEDKKKVRVAGPFTVESLSPVRSIGVGADGEPIDPLEPQKPGRGSATDTGGGAGMPGGWGDPFVRMVVEHLKAAGVQQAHKEDRLNLTSVEPWPGAYISAEAHYVEGVADEDGDDAEGIEQRAGVFIGPEFGTVARQDLVNAAREAGDAGFGVLICCAFSYDAHAAGFDKLGKVRVLRARMNADLHMAGELKNTGKGNLFVIFGEPDVGVWVHGSEAYEQEIEHRRKRLEQAPEELAAWREKRKAVKADKKMESDEKALQAKRLSERIERLEREQRQAEAFLAHVEGVYPGQMFVELRGVDVYRPSTGQVESNEPDEIACWFVDADYNDESFFVRQAYFLGASDPYKSLKTTLKAEIDAEAWETLYGELSRPFDVPDGGRVAVKVINHLGDEALRVFAVD